MSLAGNRDLSTLTIAYDDQIISLLDVDVDAVTEDHSDVRNPLGVTQSGRANDDKALSLKAGQTFSMSSTDASSRTITVPNAPSLHWDNVGRRWFAEDSVRPRLEAAPVEDGRPYEIKETGARSDRFDNAAYFPHLRRRLTSRKPCFLKDCIAGNLEQAKELAQL